MELLYLHSTEYENILHLFAWDFHQMFTNLTPTIINLPKNYLFLQTVYDVNKKRTYDQLGNWLNELEAYGTHSNMAKILVGNKTDMVSICSM